MLMESKAFDMSWNIIHNCLLLVLAYSIMLFKTCMGVDVESPGSPQ